MKNMTRNNLKKVTETIMSYDYDRNTAENMAINAFIIAKQFDQSVEYTIRNLCDKTQ